MLYEIAEIQKVEMKEICWMKRKIPKEISSLIFYNIPFQSEL